MILIMNLEKLKLKFEIVKYKLTLFTTILSAGVYILINKADILKTINENIFYMIVYILFFYGSAGFVNNISILDKIKGKVDE